MRIPSGIRDRLTGPKTERSEPSRVEACFKFLKDRLMALLIWFTSFKLFVILYRYLQNLMIGVVRVGPVPRHVSFIMDGNRRYAKRRGLSVKKGHEAGGLALLNLCYACKRIGIQCVSAYAFSIENFNRPKEEVDNLYNMFAVKLDEFAQRANSFKDPLYGSRIRVVGDHSLVAQEMRDKIKNVEEITKNGQDFTLYICFPYTSRNDIYHTLHDSIERFSKKESDAGKLTVSNFTEKMYLDNFSNKCDLLIRTSGHMRLSDYMLWQAHENSDIQFTTTLWPDFGFLKFYLMLLRWSFFTSVQKYVDAGFSLREKLYYSVPLLDNKKVVSLDSLPMAPIAVSITGEQE